MGIKLAGDGTEGDVTVPEGDLGLNTNEPGATEPEAQTPEAPAAPEAQPNDQPFFDASKVPPALQASYRAMQADYTKKTQEFAVYRDFEKNYGKLTEVQAVLDQLRDPQGVLNWWVGVAQELGISQAKLSELFQQASEPQAPAVPASPATPVLDPGATAASGGVPQVKDPSGLDRPMTVGEFQRWQQAQQHEAQQAQVRNAEDQEVAQALTNLKVAPEDRLLVLNLAKAHPAHLGYTERINRGYADLKARLDAAVAAVPAKPQVPAALGGAAPGNGGSRPGYREGSGWGEAQKGAAAFLAEFGL